MSEPDDVLSRPGDDPDAVVRYGDHADALIDVFLPAGLDASARRPARLLVFVHGGFWRQQFDRLHVRPLAGALRQRGWVVAVPEYRRTGGLGGWPQTGYDVETALEVVPRMLDAVAPGHIDPSAPLVISGHSAGGHLALWAGLRARPSRIASIVALAPVADLRYAAEARLGDSAVQALLGGGPDAEPAAYDDADAATYLPGHVPLTIIQGTADRQVPVELNRRVAAAHRTAANLQYVELADVDHFALIDPLSDAFENVVLPALGQP